MPGHRPLAVLMLTAVVVSACAAPSSAAESARPAPPARGPRAESARTAVATVRYRAEDAITHLRARLRARGFAPEVTAGPMLATWSENPPAPRLAGESAVPGAVRRAVGSPTWLVVTEAGAWWVWEHDDVGPVAYSAISRF